MILIKQRANHLVSIIRKSDNIQIDFEQDTIHEVDEETAQILLSMKSYQQEEPFELMTDFVIVQE